MEVMNTIDDTAFTVYTGMALECHSKRTWHFLHRLRDLCDFCLYFFSSCWVLCSVHRACDSNSCARISMVNNAMSYCNTSLSDGQQLMETRSEFFLLRSTTTIFSVSASTKHQWFFIRQGIHSGFVAESSVGWKRICWSILTCGIRSTLLFQLWR